jgi:hypothetical protein
MSLLTNEQIEELVGLASNQSTSKDLHDEFHEWNEKQTGVQVNVDWSKAPDIAEGVVVNAYWVGADTWKFCFEIAKFSRPKPVITPHPHAEMIAKYAEVAQRRADPWVEFEINLDNNWKKMMGNPAWLDYREYRYIGETK